ncbi:MAG: Asp-tRNA(Asn)/Glu-tRNA(Gln) amidotransferase subunit GatA [Pyramidobacter sp.]|nr:Asp-tRNA(Asn)/Glu-tRNA(Gln) amidotransferase subunit GatA [Pyramidobacter sp.]
MELYRLSAAEIVKGLNDKQFTCREVVSSCLEHIKALEPQLNAMLCVAQEQAMEDAARVDAEIAKGTAKGALLGVPVIVKDNICTSSMPTTCASKILKDWVPPYDATVITRLKDAGAIILGKTNCDEFAMGGSTENSAYGPTKNPWDTSRVPGGSSGGSAAAVAAGYAPLSLGSDTGGSIRQPAAFCGIYGMKPTYGQVSRYGLVAFASSLDQIGPFARTAEDMKLVMSVICGFDEKDSTSEDRPAPDFALGTEPLKGKKIGVLTKLVAGKLTPELEAAMNAKIEQCRALGAEIEEVSLPVSLEYGLACYYILAPAEASSNLARYDGVRYGMAHADARSLIELYVKTRKEGFGAEVKRRILTGTYVLSSGFYDAYYLTAQKVRKVIKNEFREAFKAVDAILLPASPTPAFKIGEMSDPLTMYMADIFTIPVNMAGLPGISFNTGFSTEGLPLGMQLIGPRWADASILEMAAALGSDMEGRIADGGDR